MPFLRDHYNFFRNFFKESFIVIYILGFILIFYFWYKSISIPCFKKNEIGIIFAFTNKNKKTNKAIRDLYNCLKFRIDESLSDFNFKLVKIPPEIAPSTYKETYKIREKSDATLIIWGNLEEGKKNGNDISIFMPINFTYPKLKQKQTSEDNPYDIHVDDFLSSKIWQIRSSDDLEDVENITKNVDIFSRFIIACCLNTKHAFEESFYILKKIKKENNDKNLGTRIKVLMNISLRFIALELNLKYSDKLNEEKIKKAKQIIREMYEIDKNNPHALLMDSFIDFICESKTEDAKNKISETFKSLPSYDPSPYYSMAFLQFFDEKLEYGWNRLKFIFGKIPYMQISRIIEFYEEVLADNPEKKILFFPLGVLYYKELKGMEKLAKENIEKFLKFYKFKGESWEKEIKEICDEIINKK